MLEVLKVVFVAFTQHCIQTNVTHVGGVKGVLCIQWPLTLARREGYLSLPSWGLAVHHQSGQSEEAPLLTFLDKFVKLQG